MNVRESVKDILIADVFVDVSPAEMREDDSLRDVYGLDSVGFVELRVQCEHRFGVTITNDDFTPENFFNIDSVVELIERLQHAGTVPKEASDRAVA
jgi:acyl carrier protein